MSQEPLEERSKEPPVNIDKEVREFFSNDPFFGLYAVPDKAGKYISDYLNFD